MGYHFTILRTQEGVEIPLAPSEVETIIRSHPSVENLVAKSDQLEIKLRASQGATRLYWDEGKLWTTDIDNSTLEFLIFVASQLGARVRGDELETYRSAEETFVHPDDQSQLQRSTQFANTLYRQSRRRGFLTLMAIAVAAIAMGLLVNYLTKP